MKYAVGYDKMFAQQFFKRSIREVVTGDRELAPILGQVEYVAERFSETIDISPSNSLAFPQFNGTVEELVALSSEFIRDRRLLQQAELTANLMLFREGLLCFGGFHDFRGTDEAELCWFRQGQPRRMPESQPISALYRNAAQAPFQAKPERTVLRQMSYLAPKWIDALGRIPGRDYLEQLASRASYLIILND